LRWSGPLRRRCSYVRHGPSTFFAIPRSPPSQGCGLSSPAIPRDTQQRCRTACPLERDASSQSLQPTCCHEYPRKHAIPKRWAFTLLTADSFRARSTEWELAPRGASGFSDAVRPLLVLPALGSQAVGAAPASCYRIATPEGMDGVPSKRPCGLCRPSTTRALRIADAPCRIPPTHSASRARLQVPGSASPYSTKSTAPQTRGAFHQQVPPSRQALA
jgi:hypothetical protein